MARFDVPGLPCIFTLLRPGTGALVRLRRRLHGGVEVPVRLRIHRPVTEGYCVVATRGGELPEVNCQSVTTYHSEMNHVNSIRPTGGTSLRVLCEVRPAAQAIRNGEGSAQSGTGQRDQSRVLKETVNRRKAAGSPEGGWRQNGRQRKRAKQGDLLRTERRSWPQWPEEPPGRSQSVRSSEEARNERGAKGRREVGAKSL